MFNFVSLLKYKRQTGNKLCNPAQRSEVIIEIIKHVLAAVDRLDWRLQRLPCHVSLMLTFIVV